MKKSELRKIIREEIGKIIAEDSFSRGDKVTTKKSMPHHGGPIWYRQPGKILKIKGDRALVSWDLRKGSLGRESYWVDLKYLEHR